jgi:two-component system chemotaxis sensor kinase CheA
MHASSLLGARAQEELFAEAQELVDAAERHVAALEGGDLRRAADAEQLQELFRAVHTLKGISGLFGISAITGFAHVLEDLLDALRFGRVRLDAGVHALLDDATVALRQRVAAMRAGDAPDDDAFGRLLERLRAGAAASAAAPSLDDGEIALPESLRALTAHEEHRLRARLGAGDAILAVRVRCPLDALDAALAEARGRAAAFGEVITCLPIGDALGDDMEIDVLLASTASATAVRNALERVAVDVVALSFVRPPLAAPPDELGLAARPTGEAGRMLPSVRMDVRRLDQLLASVGELALLRSSLAGIAERARGASPAPGGAELARLQRALGRTIDSLQRGLLEARMVPLGQVFERLGREVRKVARVLSKEVRLVVTGAATSLDKLQVDELGAPLAHLLRNAVDHGLEAPDARDARGKPREGTITVNAWQRGSHVVIEVEDDGRGVDVSEVRRVAVARGLVEPATASAMGPRELLALLFRPGMSTRAAVTGTSGRGVGLDVVRAAIARLGGIVDVRTELGHFTRVTITLPVTLAIVSCLVVETAGRQYAIPLAAVAEVTRAPRAEAQRVDGRAVLSRHGRTIPLFVLGRWLGHGGAVPAAPLAVLLAFAGRVVGLRVDRIISRRDVVIKPLGPSLRDVRGFAGAAEFGDRAVTLVLDPAALLEDLLASEHPAEDEVDAPR